MTSSNSVNNRTITPLGASRTYIGTYDSVLQFATAVILVNSDTTTQLTIFQSPDKSRTYTQIINILPGAFTTLVNITSPFLYCTLRNTSGSAQTYLNFEVIYREAAVVNSVTTSSITRVGTNFTGPLATSSVCAPLSLNAYNAANLSVFGSVSGACTLAVQLSQDSLTYFTSQYSVTFTGASEFGFTIPCASSYVRIKRTDAGASRNVNINVQAC